MKKLLFDENMNMRVRRSKAGQKSRLILFIAAYVSIITGLPVAFYACPPEAFLFFILILYPIITVALLVNIIKFFRTSTIKVFENGIKPPSSTFLETVSKSQTGMLSFDNIIRCVWANINDRGKEWLFLETNKPSRRIILLIQHVDIEDTGRFRDILKEKGVKVEKTTWKSLDEYLGEKELPPFLRNVVSPTIKHTPKLKKQKFHYFFIPLALIANLSQDLIASCTIIGICIILLVSTFFVMKR